MNTGTLLDIYHVADISMFSIAAGLKLMNLQVWTLRFSVYHSMLRQEMQKFVVYLTIIYLLYLLIAQAADVELMIIIQFRGTSQLKKSWKVHNTNNEEHR